MDTVTTSSPSIASQLPTVAGSPFGGGFFAGHLLVAGVAYALIVAPRGEGEHEEAPWSESSKAVPGARSFFDGLANTDAMADAGSELAKWARNLRIAGNDDWYLPSRDELEILYRSFKPTDEENYCWRGDNPSSVPVGYAYSRDNPAQTSVEIFRAGGDEAFEEDWYWSSTQYAGDEASAWCQTFGNGIQGDGHKDTPLRARAVRRLKI